MSQPPWSTLRALVPLLAMLETQSLSALRIMLLRHGFLLEQRVTFKQMHCRLTGCKATSLPLDAVH